MKYHIITNDCYFLVGVSSIFKNLGISFSSEFLSSPDRNVCIMKDTSLVVCFFHHIGLYQKQLMDIGSYSDCVFLVVDSSGSSTGNMGDFPIIISSSLPVDTFVATILSIDYNWPRYPRLTFRMKVIIDSFYQNSSLSSISRRAGVSEKSVYGIKRHLIKTMGLGNLNSAYGLIIARCIVILQECYNIRN